MKKWSGAFLILILILTGTGCGSQSQEAENPTKIHEAAKKDKAKESTVNSKETIQNNKAIDATSDSTRADRPDTVQDTISDSTEADKPDAVQDSMPDSTRADKPDTAPDNTSDSTPVNNERATAPADDNVSQRTAFVPYSPDRVVSIATARCQAGGMITTQQNLKNSLDAGKITREEYNEYYPYDGLENSYYSVFVETDLSRASTVSGKRLETEDEIAQYIADMLLLENEPVFYISYDGICTVGGTDFYEFRCHR